MDASIEISYEDINSLIPYARNSRTHSDAQIAQVAASIREFGFVNPVLLSEDNSIVAGHCRVMAARILGLDKIPCVRLSHLSETQRKAYVIADNKLAENAGWDFDALALELQELVDSDFDMDLTGFDNQDIEELLKDDEFEFKDPNKKSDDIEKLELKIICVSLSEKQELFDELNNRGIKVKSA